MKKVNYVLLILVTSLSVYSCSKSEWKKPTEVTFMVDINKEETMDGKLFFTEGHVVLRSISFDGIRTQAEDVYFEAEFDGGLEVPFSSSHVKNELVFNIPQGTYSSVRIDFQAERSDTQLNIVKGFFTNSSGDEIPVIIQLEEIEFYDKKAENISGGLEIDFIAGNPKTATIDLDPVYWISSVSATQMNNAQTTEVDGVLSIVISPDVNEEIYDIINDKIGSNAQIIIN